MTFRSLWQLLKETFIEWRKDHVSRLAAALAYYTAISISPLLIIVIAMAGFIFGSQQAQNQLIGQIQGLVGGRGAQLLATVIQNSSRPSTASLAGILSLLTLLWASTNVFAQLQEALNAIWDVQPKPGRGVRALIRDRLFSFVIVLIIGFLLLASLVASAGLAIIGNFFAHLLPASHGLWQLVNYLISFGVITLLFGLMFKLLPDVEVAWRDIWLGAAVTSLLFVSGNFLISLYLGWQSVSSVYGAAGSLVVVLLWVYYSAQIFLLGGEFTQVYARRYGQGVKPAENAARRGAKPMPRMGNA